ncbi:carbohydrate ABC transporter permease [Glycomyces algeriensis]|uniref:ABC transporter permease n=1 Tax=Glycomyces algeriensis TaxID=256037 RepID=A0A9W6G5I8_9ACTN|nr:carbohydrate ABC transporter permease [Glycomyces algeriensis]MDA1367608.1 carbohydrate ABC transporter permease [Glycomyces algeriensis]MDR7353029.1 putative aldouronate transport system permease protein [Glycomyces algeriensis]GLI40719.1 ABC transporter permease [Glycomyces algeriensis]
MSTLTATRSRRRDQRPAWDEEPSFLGKSVKALFLLVYAAAIIVPLWAVLATSLATEDALVRSGGDMIFLPTDISLQAYREILSGGAVTKSLLFTLMLTAVGTAISLVLTVGAAYGLSRPGSVWHRKMLTAILVTLLFAPGMYPSYLVVQDLGLLNDMWALILPVCFSAWNLIVLRTFFMTSVPGELIDAAKIDGAGEFRTLFKVVLPMSKAILAVIGLFYAVGYWNTYFLAVLYTPGLETKPIQVLIQQWLIASTGPAGQDAAAAAAISSGMENAPAASLKMAAVVCTIIPIVIMYPFIQKHFTKAVITGAIKG